MQDLEVEIPWAEAAAPVVEADHEQLVTVYDSARARVVAEVHVAQRIIPRTVEVKVDAATRRARVSALFAREVAVAGSSAADGVYTEVDVNTFDNPVSNLTLTLAKDKWRVQDCFGGVVLQAAPSKDGAEYIVPWRVQMWKEHDPAANDGKGKLVKKKAVKATRVRTPPADPAFTLHYPEAVGPKKAKQKEKQKKGKKKRSSTTTATTSTTSSTSESLSSTTDPYSADDTPAPEGARGSSHGGSERVVGDVTAEGSEGTAFVEEDVADEGDGTRGAPVVTGSMFAGDDDDDDYEDDYEDDCDDGSVEGPVEGTGEGREGRTPSAVATLIDASPQRGRLDSLERMAAAHDETHGTPAEDEGFEEELVEAHEARRTSSLAAPDTTGLDVSTDSHSVKESHDTTHAVSALTLTAGHASPRKSVASHGAGDTTGFDMSVDDDYSVASSGDERAAALASLADVASTEGRGQLEAEEVEGRGALEEEERSVRAHLLEAYRSGLEMHCLRKVQMWWRQVAAQRRRLAAQYRMHQLEATEVAAREATAREEVTAAAGTALLAAVSLQAHDGRAALATEERRARSDATEAAAAAAGVVTRREAALLLQAVQRGHAARAVVAAALGRRRADGACAALCREESDARAALHSGQGDAWGALRVSAHASAAAVARVDAAAEERSARDVLVHREEEARARGVVLHDEASGRMWLREEATAAAAAARPVPLADVEVELLASPAPTPLEGDADPYATDWTDSAAEATPVAAGASAAASEAELVAASNKIKRAWKAKRLRKTVGNVGRESVAVMVQNYEAVKVQRNWRGYTARKTYGGTLKRIALERLEWWVREDIARESILRIVQLMPHYYACRGEGAVCVDRHGALHWAAPHAGHDADDDADAGYATEWTDSAAATPAQPQYDTDWSDSTAAATPARTGRGMREPVAPPAPPEDRRPRAPSEAEMLDATVKIQRRWKRYRFNKVLVTSGDSLAVMITRYEAVKIQRNWRGYSTRREVGQTLRRCHTERYEFWVREDLARESITRAAFSLAPYYYTCAFPDVVRVNGAGELEWYDTFGDTFSDLGESFALMRTESAVRSALGGEAASEADERFRQLADLLGLEEASSREVTVQSEARGFQFVADGAAKDLRGIAARHNRAVAVKYRALLQAAEADEAAARAETTRDETAHLTQVQQKAIFERHVAKRRAIEGNQRRRVLVRERDARVAFTLDEMVSWAVLSAEITAAIPGLEEYCRQQQWVVLHGDEHAFRKAILKERGRWFDAARTSFVRQMHSEAEDKWRRHHAAAAARTTRGSRAKAWPVVRTAFDEVGCIPPHPSKLRPASALKRRIDKVREDVRAAARPAEAGGFSEYALRFDKAKRKAMRADAALARKIPTERLSQQRVAVRWSPHQKRKRGRPQSAGGASLAAAEVEDVEAELLLLNVALGM